MQSIGSLDAKRDGKGQNKKYPSLLDDLLKVSGDGTKIIMSPELARFVGSANTAIMLSQILYWHVRTKNQSRRFFKSDKEWQKELSQSRHAVRASRSLLEEMQLIRTVLKKAKGAPTTHYQCDWEQLQKMWGSFMSVSPEQWKETVKEYKAAVKARQESSKETRKHAVA
jgi:hypothetical protein